MGRLREILLRLGGLAVVAVALLCAPHACGAVCAPPSFGAATNFTVGNFPESVVVADFNGDGKPDLAVANTGSDTVSVLLGTGSGGFGAATHFTAGSDPDSVVAGDFNGDRTPDLAVANNGSNTVSVLLGTGGGGFGAATNFEVGSGPYSVVAGDFDGDRRPDLAVANSGSNTVSVLRGTGGGGFGSATTYTVGSSPRSVVMGDFNGDARPDLAVASYDASTVSVLLGTGTGSFGAATSYTVPTAIAAAVGDFNRDGKLDLAIADSDADAYSVLLGTGGGNFGASTKRPVGPNVNSVAVGDFNGDGTLDLAVVINGSSEVAVLLGSGNGSFGSATTYAVGSYPHSVAVADFNGDGTLDLVVANEGSETVSVLLGTCPARTNTPTTTATPTFTPHPCSGVDHCNPGELCVGSFCATPTPPPTFTPTPTNTPTVTDTPTVTSTPTVTNTPDIGAWRVSPDSSSCTGPVDWASAPFDDSLWQIPTLPDTRTLANNANRYYRKRVVLTSPALGLFLQSDDGAEMFVNGTFIGPLAGTCPNDGCVNLPACSINYAVPQIDVDPGILVVGENVIAVHMWNTSFDAYFDLAVSTPLASPTPTSTPRSCVREEDCNSGEICVGSHCATPTASPTNSPTITRTPTVTLTPTITVSPTPKPTRDATAQCPLPRPAPPGPAIWIADQIGTAGSPATITVILAAGGAQISGVQADLMFPATAPIAVKPSGRPACTVNPDIDKNATSFSFRPTGCDSTACTTVRALVLDTDSTDPIPDGAALFSCDVVIADNDGSLEYTFGTSILADPIGAKVTDVGDQSGEICFAGPTPTPTPTPACDGDCDGDHIVTISEVIRLVNIALGNAPPADCLRGIASGITAILHAVGNALNDCPA